MFNTPKKFRTTLLLVLLYVSLPVFLVSTNPQRLPIILLILPVVLLFIILYTTVYLLLTRKVKLAKSISKTRLIVIAGLTAIVPVLMLVLASIRQFTLKDILLTIALLVCVSWYLLKVDFLKT
jgi:hypothetical protein